MSTKFSTKFSTKKCTELGNFYSLYFLCHRNKNLKIIDFSRSMANQISNNSRQYQTSTATTWRNKDSNVSGNKPDDSEQLPHTKSAFFIDTAARQFTLPHGQNRIRIAVKLLLLLIVSVLSVELMYQLNYYDHKHQPSSPLFPFGSAITRSYRHAALLVCYLTFTLRVWLQMVFVWQRAVSWHEIIAETCGIIPLSFFSIAYFTPTTAAATTTERSRSERQERFLLITGLAVFLFGTCLNIVPELQRALWKQHAENKGKLYNGGLFAFARHINYTGEIASFVGIAMVSRNICSLWVPLVMGTGLVTVSVAELEFYLKQKYPKSEWEMYRKQTPYSFIPWVY